MSKLLGRHPGKSATIRILDLNEIVSAWIANKPEAYFAYIEGETDSTFFEHFLPTSQFPLGLPEDEQIKRLVERYNSEVNMNQAAENAKAIGLHMESLGTYIPVSYPKVHLVLSRKFEPINTGVRAAYLIPFTEFRSAAE